MQEIIDNIKEENAKLKMKIEEITEQGKNLIKKFKN